MQSGRGVSRPDKRTRIRLKPTPKALRNDSRTSSCEPRSESVFSLNSSADFRQQFPPALWLAAFLPEAETRFSLSLRKDMRNKGIQKFLHAHTLRTCRLYERSMTRFITAVRNRFHVATLRCSAGVTIRGCGMRSSPEKSLLLCVTRCSTEAAIASSST